MITRYSQPSFRTSLVFGISFSSATLIPSLADWEITATAVPRKYRIAGNAAEITIKM